MQQANQSQYVCWCSKLIEFNLKNYVAHIWKCKICQKTSQLLIAQNSNKDQTIFTLEDLLIQKTVLHIAYNKLGLDQNQQFFYFEEFLLNNKTQQVMEGEIKKDNQTLQYSLYGKEFYKNNYFQNTLEIHKTAYKFEILYINFQLSKMIFKYLLKDLPFKFSKQTVPQNTNLNCEKCNQENPFAIFLHQICNSQICIKCLNQHVSRIEQNKIECWFCKNQLDGLTIINFSPNQFPTELQIRDSNNLEKMECYQSLKGKELLKMNPDIQDTCIELKATIMRFLFLDSSTLIFVDNSGKVKLFSLSAKKEFEIFTTEEIPIIQQIKSIFKLFLTYSDQICKIWQVETSNTVKLLQEINVGLGKNVQSISNTNLLLCWGEKKLEIFDFVKNLRILKHDFPDNIYDVFVHSNTEEIIVISKLGDLFQVSHLKIINHTLELIYQNQVKMEKVINVTYFEYLNQDYFCFQQGATNITIYNIRKQELIFSKNFLDDEIPKFQQIVKIVKTVIFTLDEIFLAIFSITENKNVLLKKIVSQTTEKLDYKNLNHWEFENSDFQNMQIICQEDQIEIYILSQEKNKIFKKVRQ